MKRFSHNFGICQWGKAVSRVTAFLAIAFLIGAPVAAGAGDCSCAGPEKGSQISRPPFLNVVREKLATVLHGIDKDLSLTASKLSGKGISGPKARIALRGLCERNSFAVDCAFVDRAGRMKMVEPQAYGKFEGADISGQEQVKRLHHSGKPVMSDVFLSLEGFEAVDLEHPVFSPQNMLVGSVSVLMKPEDLMSGILSEDAGKESPLEIWVMQVDGRVLYRGKKLKSGLDFLSSVPLMECITREKEGHGFSGLSGKGSGKDVFWTTVSLHGTEWRIVTFSATDSSEHVR